VSVDAVRIVAERLGALDSAMHNVTPEDWADNPGILLESIALATGITNEMCDTLAAISNHQRMSCRQ
jgi:hypothetical protein